MITCVHIAHVVLWNEHLTAIVRMPLSFDTFFAPVSRSSGAGGLRVPAI